MIKILNKFKDWIIIWIAILLVFWVANAWVNLWTVNTWDSLTSTKWNELVTNVNEVWNRVSWLVMDYKYTENNTALDLPTTIIWDDTIPQITEGNQLFTLNITPKKIWNILVFEWVVNWFEPSNHSDFFIASLFKNWVNDAIASVSTSASANTQCSWSAYQNICSFPVKFIVPADSTSSTTYSLRVWLNGWNIIINRSYNWRKLWWALKSFLSVTEYAQ